MAWLAQPQAEPAGTWTRQGQRRIGDAAGGANDIITGATEIVPQRKTPLSSASGGGIVTPRFHLRAIFASRGEL